MPQRPQCRIEDELVHKGFDKTNRTAERDGHVWEVWTCQCGKKQHLVIPGKGRRNW